LLATVIIDNYNYGRYLAEAIESALQQSYERTEVIVVDDGSTDNSRDVIASYGERIIPVLKENGGQASAFNAGLERSQGDIVIFLDADDVLLPGTVARAVEAFRTQPDAAKVQYRMEIIDGQGRRTGKLKPPDHLPLRSGDLRQDVLTFPDDLTWMATSGNAFSARVLSQVAPVPEEDFSILADRYLALLAPLLGPVLSLRDVGAYYRIHGSNHYDRSVLSLTWVRETVGYCTAAHVHIKKYADRLELGEFPSDPLEVLSVAFLGHRLVSLKLDPEHHPIARDTKWSLFSRGVLAASRRFDVSILMKAVYVLWFAAMAVSPRPVARWLAEKFFFPDTRGPFNRFIRLFSA
jgi:glycosyltransferase involved in cell wall biosynthesis